MFKNVTLVETEVNGKLSWRLLDPDGRPIAAFDVFAKILERRPLNTRKNYLYWLAEFIDYLFEAVAFNTDGIAISREGLLEIIEAYDDYLVLGAASDNSIVKRVCNTMPSPGISKNSSATKHAAIRKFLKVSERYRKQMVELSEAGYLSEKVSNQQLIEGIFERRELNLFERQAMARNSVLAGCISRGPQLIAEAVLPTSTPNITYDYERAFPFDRVGDVVLHLPSYRDKALYLFCAASGCRISEVLQLLWDDVDIAKQKVYLIDPKSRPNSPSYLALKPVERDQLVWKGRATKLTLLIEPFASMFFDALASYLRYEYVPHGRHKFVFQYSFKGEKGRPYFLATASSRNDILNRAIKKSGILGVSGPHSFRHMYGTYLLNYFPRINGTYGLPIGLVQKLMGHMQLKDTEKYARPDKDLIEAELQFANMSIYGNGNVKSINELKREILLAKLREIESALLSEIDLNI